MWDHNQHLRVPCAPSDYVPIKGGMHKHLCPNCGHCWKHNCNEVQGNRARFNLAHTCSECGTVQTMKHYTAREETEREECEHELLREIILELFNHPYRSCDYV